MSNADDVIAYFEGTRWDYRHLWRSEKTGALHFGYYDTSTRSHQAAVRSMTDVLAEAADVAAGDRVLDAGCGLGGCAIRLARRFGCTVTGVNITPYQVETARVAVGRAGVGNLVDLVQADFTATGLEAGRYTVVWALESVVHTADRSGFLREAYRLLAPGGRLMIAEYLVRDTPDLSQREGQDVATWRQGWAMPELLRDSDYRRLLGGQGFEDVRVVDLSQNVLPSLRRLGRMIRILSPVAPLCRRLGILGPVPAANLLASAAQLRTFDSGAWRYKVVLARKPGSQSQALTAETAK